MFSYSVSCTVKKREKIAAGASCGNLLFLLFLRDEPVPVDLFKLCFRDFAGHRADLHVAVAHFGEGLENHIQFEGMIMLPEDFLLDDLVFPFKGIEQVEGDGSVGIVVPYLDQVDPGVVPEEGIIQVKALAFPPDLFPVPGVKAEISARSYSFFPSILLHASFPAEILTGRRFSRKRSFSANALTAGCTSDMINPADERKN